MSSVTAKIVEWNQERQLQHFRGEMAKRLNKAGAFGLMVVQQIAPRDTGFMANTMEIIHDATAGELYVSWGNVTATYTIWQEIGSRGRPGRYFLRTSLQRASDQLMRAG